MPTPKISNDKIEDLVDEGIRNETKYLVGKMNAGMNNENVKFPEEYRIRLNEAILTEMDLLDKSKQLSSIHSNNLTSVLPLWA